MTNTYVTANPTWGFYATIKTNLGLSEADAAAAFAAAGEIIAKTFNAPAQAAIQILDSSTGRHLADQIEEKALLAPSLEKTLKRWRRQILEELGEIMQELAGPKPRLSVLLKKLPAARQGEIRDAYYKAAEGLQALRRALQQADAEAGGSTELLAEFYLAARADDTLGRSKLGTYL